MNKYPSTFYRVSLKAVVKNDVDQVLVVKEGSDEWSLPGGGLDHGEAASDGLVRELQEELGTAIIVKSMAFRSTYTFHARATDVWYLWILYDVTISTPDSLIGAHVTEAQYLSLEDFRKSDSRSRRRIVEALSGIQVDTVKN